MMGRISTEAGLSKRYTNHCIKATVATGLKRKGIDLLSIMAVTGHRNIKSLDSYIDGPSDSDRRKLSSALQTLGHEDSSPISNGTTPLTSAYITTVSLTVSSNIINNSDTTCMIEDRKISSQTVNVAAMPPRNPLSDNHMNIFQGANISGGNITINFLQKDFVTQ